MAEAKHPNHAHSASNAYSHHRKSGRDSSSSAEVSKYGPSPNSISIPAINIGPDNEIPSAKPMHRPENLSQWPEMADSISERRFSFPPAAPSLNPSYGFHMLDRRALVLADGSVRSYFALPPDYENVSRMPVSKFSSEFIGGRDFGPTRTPFPVTAEFRFADAGVRNPENLNLGGESSLKRKFVEDEREGKVNRFERQRQQLLQYGKGNEALRNCERDAEVQPPKNGRDIDGNVSKRNHIEVDQNELKKAFLHFVKVIFESASHKYSFLADGKKGPLPCLACSRSNADSCLSCSRSSTHFLDMHSLIIHAYNFDTADSIVNHQAFHRALCVLMGWNYMIPPDNLKAYQTFSTDEAQENKDDLILWPPTVLIYNSIRRKHKEGRMEGIGNRMMDIILGDLGFPGSKPKSLYAREGHLGIHAVKFSANESGLNDALRMADHFERNKHGRKEWARVKPSIIVSKDDNTEVEKPIKTPTEKSDPRIQELMGEFYGHLATVDNLAKLPLEVKKGLSIASIREFKQNPSMFEDNITKVTEVKAS